MDMLGLAQDNSAFFNYPRLIAQLKYRMLPSSPGFRGSIRSPASLSLTGPVLRTRRSVLVFGRAAVSGSRILLRATLPCPMLAM
jgi:hypothetical protein